MVLRCGVGTPRRSVGPRHGVACPHCGVAEREDLASLGYASIAFGEGLHRSVVVLRQGVATVHNMQIF